MLNENEWVAGTRFGMGLSPADLSAMGGSPQNWLLQQLRTPQLSSPDFAGLPTQAASLQRLLDAREEVRQGKMDKRQALGGVRKDLKETFLAELRAKINLAAATETPFYERLVGFWSNHFSVSVKKAQIAGLAGAYERETIRPHILGKFSDVLLAVARSPAMLLYLDNAQSIGPQSAAGERQGKGLNENLAREILELHTLGVDGGYTQGDVTSFARVITGWGIGRPESGRFGQFFFAERRHEPGTQYVLGRAYADDGEAQGVAVLRDLAVHPATARHIATKLARHFIADDPPADAVAQLANVFSDTGGDLPAVYSALTGISQAWDARAFPKIKSSYDLVVSAARICGRTGAPYDEYCLKSLKFLGDIPFTANSPAGFPDTAQDLAGPEAMVRRVEWAQMAAVKFAPDAPVGELAERAAGPAASAALRDALKNAARPRQAVAMLLGSPDFQRR